MAAKIPPIAERKPVYMPLPIGKVRFSQLEKPDTHFSEDRPKFNITMVYTPEELAPFRSKVETLYEEWKETVTKAAKGKKVVFNDIPFKDDFEKPVAGADPVPTGLIRVTAQCDAERGVKNADGSITRTLRPVPLFDNSKPTPLPVTGVKCYGGATARPNVAVSFYASANPKIGCGISFKLSAVQIIKASGGARSAAGYGFDAVEDETSDIAGSDTEDAPETEFTEGQNL